jgi:hypothetical protein
MVGYHWPWVAFQGLCYPPVMDYDSASLAGELKKTFERKGPHGTASMSADE